MLDVQNTNYNYNPFALSTARSAWADKDSSLPTRLFKGMAGAAYDLYAKNPYDLIIGNCEKLLNATEPPSTRTKIAVIATAVFAALYTLMFYGTTFHLNGRCLQALGSKTGLAVISKVGEASKALGENLFITGAVPIYGLFYIIPKHIVLTMPKIVHFVAAKVAFAANWVFQHVLAPLWTKVILPTAQIVLKGIHFVATKIGSVLKSISRIVASAANWIFQHVLTPLWEKALLPVLKAVGKVVHFVLSQIGSALHTIGLKIANSAQWMFKNVIVPVWSKVIFPSLKALGNGISCLAKGIGNAISAVVRTVAHTAQWIFQHVIAPVWSKLVLPVLKAARHVISLVAKAIGDSIQTLAQATVKVASFIFQKIIAPVFHVLTHLILTAGKFLSNYVIKPLGSVLANLAGKVGRIFKVAFDSVVVPLIKGVASGFNAVSNVALEVWQTITTIWNKVSLIL